jgi:hypothetical protein
LTVSIWDRFSTGDDNLCKKYVAALTGVTIPNTLRGMLTAASLATYESTGVLVIANSWAGNLVGNYDVTANVNLAGSTSAISFEV